MPFRGPVVVAPRDKYREWVAALLFTVVFGATHLGSFNEIGRAAPLLGLLATRTATPTSSSCQRSPSSRSPCIG